MANPERSIDTILREAWKTIQREHNIALESVDFNLYDSSTCSTVDRTLVDIKIEAIPLIKQGSYD